MLGLRLLGSDTVLGSLFERLLYRESAAVEIGVPPAKGQQFSPARAGPERERGQHIERAAAQLPQQFLGFGGLEDFDLCGSHLRRLDMSAGLSRNKPQAFASLKARWATTWTCRIVAVANPDRPKSAYRAARWAALIA